jgi:spermidine/putrescine-binding protein
LVQALAFTVLCVFCTPAGAAPIDDLIKGAKQEGTIEFYAPSTLTPQGAQAIGAAFNKKYGLNIKLQYSPSGNMTRDIGKVVGLGASGVPPEWDLMVVTDAHHATLWVKKMHQPFDYKSIGVDPKAVQYDNGSVSFAEELGRSVEPQVEGQTWRLKRNPSYGAARGRTVGRGKNHELRQGAYETGFDSGPPRGNL